MAILIPKLIEIKPSGNLLDEACPPTDNIITAEYAMVGSFPTLVEVKEKEPFVGPAGNQLKRICSAVKIPMYQIYLTHACKAMIPKNNSNKLYTEKGFRCSEWGELQQKLIKELSQFNGKLIILLGDFAMRLLLDEPKFNSITKYRGSIYYAEEFPHLAELLKGKLIGLSYHPSFTLLNMKPVSFYIMIMDITKFIEVNDNPELLELNPTLHTKPLFDEVINFYHRAMTKDLIGFDIECTPKYITCFSIAFYNSTGVIESMSIPLMSNKGNYWSVQEELEIWNNLALLMLNKEIKKVCQNGMFDLMFLLRTMKIISDNFYFDTMIAQHIVYTDLPKGLDFLTSIYTCFPYYKDEGKQSHLSIIKDWNMYWKYNAKDSAYLLPIMKKLQEELTLFEATDAMEYSMTLHKPFMEMEYNGIMTNREGILTAKKEFENEVVKLKAALLALTKQELNTASSKQMIAYFYGKLMIKPYVQRSGKGKGNPTCNAVALSRIARKKTKGSEEAKIILKIRKLAKLISTYFNVNTDADHRLRCSHNITGTKYGRISTGQTFFGTGTNLQNQTYEYKKYLIPDKGKILCEVDLAKAEAHVVAYLTQDINMITAFTSGVDVHSFNASKIFDVPIETVIKEAKENKADQKTTKRYMGKKVVHASNYGMKGQTFSDNLAKENIFMTKSECDALLRRYVSRFPGLPNWHRLIKEEVQRNRVLYNLFNRPCRFLGVMNQSLFMSAYSFKPQSTVAELLNRGTVKLCNDTRLDRNHYDIDLLATVHDSDVFQFEVSVVPNLLEMLLIIQDHLTHTFTYKGKSFTIGLDAKIGYQWAGDKTAEISSFTKENVENALHKIGVK